MQSSRSLQGQQRISVNFPRAAGNTPTTVQAVLLSGFCFYQKTFYLCDKKVCLGKQLSSFGFRTRFIRGSTLGKKSLHKLLPRSKSRDFLFYGKKSVDTDRILTVGNKMPTSGSCAVIHPNEARARKEAKPRELPQTSPKTASKTQPDRIRYQDRKVSPKVMGRGIPHTWLVSHHMLLPHKENALEILTARPGVQCRFAISLPIAGGWRAHKWEASERTPCQGTHSPINPHRRHCTQHHG
jgi:hypothetical protein